MEFEACIFKPLRQHPPAFQDELRFRSENCSAHLEHPFTCRQTCSAPQYFSQLFHQFDIGHRIGCGDVENARQVFPLTQEFDGAANVFDMDPAEHLLAFALLAAQSITDQINIWFHDTAVSPEHN